jgi:probable phosphoglycerate mutase
MIEIVLVRHGEPDWEPGGRAVDEPVLTPLGHEQARRVAIELGNEQFDAVYVSPLVRAVETAEPVLEALGVKPRVESWLAELRLPELQGMTPEQVQRFFEQARARDLETHWEGLPGGETFRHFYERITTGVEELLVGGHRLGLHQNTGHRVWQVPETDAQKILIVAHAGTNAVILSHLLGIEPVPWAYIRFESAWAGISRIRTVPLAGRCVWALGCFSRTGHLAGLPDSSADGGVRKDAASPAIASGSESNSESSLDSQV